MRVVQLNCREPWSGPIKIQLDDLFAMWHINPKIFKVPRSDSVYFVGF